MKDFMLEGLSGHLDRKPEFARTVAAVALGMGILADVLLRYHPWGLNFFLWMAVLVAALGWLATRRTPATWSPETRNLLAIALVFACAVVLRASPLLKAVDVLVIGVTLSIPALRATIGSMRRAGITDHAAAAAFSGVSGAFGSFFLIGAADWKQVPGGGWQRRAVPVVRGLLLALPLLLLFGALFASADAAFAAVVAEVFDIDFERVVEHLAIIGFFTWVVGGYLWGLFSGTRVPTLGEARLGRGSLGVVEVGIVMGLLVALFLSFLGIQARYYFGGEALVETTTGLTYAEYARAGFFELVVVAALVLPVLLAADWLLRAESDGPRRLYRVLAGVQLILLFAVMVSAVQRLLLYQSAYGLTDDRLYALVFMAWLAAVFLWFAASVLRGRRERFAFGALVAGWITVVGLNVMNPDALIVRVNAARVEAGQDFDAAYALSLSEDAVASLVDALPSLRPADRCVVAEELLDRWSAPDLDWRTFSFGRWSAARTMRAAEAELRAFPCDQAPAPADAGAASGSAPIELRQGTS